jgi:hypothetical protein
VRLFLDKDALLDAIIDATGAGLVVPALPGLEGRRAAAGSLCTTR